jgi:hypothetical protein
MMLPLRQHHDVLLQVCLAAYAVSISSECCNGAVALSDAHRGSSFYFMSTLYCSCALCNKLVCMTAGCPLISR